MERRTITIKKVAIKSSVGFTYANSVRDDICLFKINNALHTIECEELNGGAANWDAFTHWLLHDKDCRRQLIWAATEYVRQNPVWISIKKGMSGCEDITLRYCPNHDRVHSWARFSKSRVGLKFHISGYGKLNEGIPKTMFFGDIFEVLCHYYGSDKVLDKLSNRPGRLDRNFKYLKFHQSWVNDDNEILPSCYTMEDILARRRNNA